jgi:UDP-N-acetylmuramoylalanine--D-glutamate ligase
VFFNSASAVIDFDQKWLGRDQKYMTLSDKKVLVVGMGASGEAVARFLTDRGASVTVNDAGDNDQVRIVRERLRARGIDTVIGEHPVEIFNQADLICLSPGVPHTLPPLTSARNLGIPVIGEIELASQFIHEPIVAITGTNGKTTTTTLIGEMLAASGRRTFVGGNIGRPLIEYPMLEKPADTVVVEVSSFQLDTIDMFRPNISVLLNITPDHLNRYPDFDAYARSKGRIFENQGPTDTAIYLGNDDTIASLLSRRSFQQLPFYPIGQAPLDFKQGAAVTEQAILIRQNDREYWIDLNHIRLVGDHQRENIAAACLAALAAGGTVEGIHRALEDFDGLPHRMEPIGTFQGVMYINDSKGTNVNAVARALATFETVILIMGGQDKEGDFATLVPLVSQRVKHLIVLGDAAARIAKVMQGVVAIQQVEDMAEAVKLARDLAVPGDVVLLSPGCASFDQYENYAARGNDFRRQVEQLT